LIGCGQSLEEQAVAIRASMAQEDQVNAEMEAYLKDTYKILTAKV
jgi:hypothetical protein